jgi:hypothetical protein
VLAVATDARLLDGTEGGLVELHCGASAPDRQLGQDLLGRRTVLVSLLAVITVPRLDVSVGPTNRLCALLNHGIELQRNLPHDLRSL